MIINKIISKKIWIIDFFDFIFAEENLEHGFRIITTISIYNTIHKMDFIKKIYNVQALYPSSELGRIAIQVHEYRQ